MTTRDMTRRGELAPDELLGLLKASATTSERVRGLLALSLLPAEVARACRVSVAALRTWATGQAQPRPDALISLDDLRATAKILLDGGMEPERAANWLRGWDPKIDGRPLDVISSRPMEVRAAACGEILAPA